MDQTGEHALQLIDKLLAERPDRVGHDFSETTRNLVAYRGELTATYRRTKAETDLKRLGCVNGVISVIVGGHFPLGPVPWPEIEKARDAFARLVQETA